MQYIVCLGDSLTEQGYQNGWVSLLSDHYRRRATVLNAGQGGYTSKWTLELLQDPAARHRIVPPHFTEPLFVTLLLGSNDAGTPLLGVPVPDFRANMTSLLHLIHKELKPKYGIFLLTPPPLHEERRIRFKQLTKPERTFTGVRAYRAAIVDLVAEFQRTAPELHVQLVDTHNAILLHKAPATLVEAAAAAGEAWAPAYDPTAPWTELLHEDGLHINRAGGQVFFDTLMAAIKASVFAKELQPAQLPELAPGFPELLRREEEKAAAAAAAPAEGADGQR